MLEQDDPTPPRATPRFPLKAVLIPIGIPLLISIFAAIVHVKPDLHIVHVNNSNHWDLDFLFIVNTSLVAPLCGLIAGIRIGLHFKAAKSKWWLPIMLLAIAGSIHVAIAVSCVGCAVVL